MSNYDNRINEDGRLIILKELARQVDGRLNEASLQHVLDAFAIVRSREWIRTQLRKMEELGAVRLDEVGSVLVAELTRLGRAHVERREIIEGISRPSDQ